VAGTRAPDRGAASAARQQPKGQVSAGADRRV